MKLNYFFAGAITTLWLILAIAFGWDSNHSPAVNIVCGVATFILLGLAYLTPVWLIFGGW